MKPKEYRVWFDQVNQTVITISAMTEDKALEKAEKEWRRIYGSPSWSYYEEVKADESSS